MKSFSMIPTTRERMEQVTGDPIPYTTVAFEVLWDSQSLGFIGYYRMGTYYVLYSWINDNIELQRYRRAVVLAYCRMMNLLLEKGLPIYSHADEDIDGSDRLLEHIGFKQKQGRTYKWPG